ncbi:MAG: formylmethanofuran--tetrahydromethanopterin N-formyltransferase [Pirellulales bacterium]|nr:formylmethanofuran--tetrahydromethanopterin N-formyltransferase [Pirellulales bacterium]
MQLGSTWIDDTYAEAFRLRYARLIVTAADDYWLAAATRAVTGYACSIIACDAEAGPERRLPADQSPDGRPAVALLFFGFSTAALGAALVKRAGQCLMTCPSTAVYDGLPESAERIPLGQMLRFFGDGFQKSKQIASTRYWRIPVMDGEFLCVESVGVEKGIGGGNIIIQADQQATVLAAVRQAVQAVAELPGVITPFPGGAARSGSKVGSRYQKLRASTAEAFCPTLRGRVASRLHPAANHACEIVFDGVDETSVGRAMATALRAGALPDVVALSAGNYGGNLGKFHFHLRQLLAEYHP